MPAMSANWKRIPWGAITSADNAATATKLATARAINGVNFDGTAAITVTADGESAEMLAQLLNLAGLQGKAEHACPTCGESPCVCVKEPSPICEVCGESPCVCKKKKIKIKRKKEIFLKYFRKLIINGKNMKKINSFDYSNVKFKILL